MKHLSTGILLFLTFLVSGNSGADAPTPLVSDSSPAQTADQGGGEQPDAALARARGAVQRLVPAVLAELTKALAEGPPEHAIRVCHEAAQRITEELAAREGLSIRRTALRLRNPKNAPDEYERQALEEWSRPGARPEARHEVVATPQGGQELRYLQPIVLAPLCTACHGLAEEISPEVRAALAGLYPGDQAIGFRPGGLRGAVSVRIPLPLAQK